MYLKVSCRVRSSLFRLRKHTETYKFIISLQRSSIGDQTHILSVLLLLNIFGGLIRL